MWVCVLDASRYNCCIAAVQLPFYGVPMDRTLLVLPGVALSNTEVQLTQLQTHHFLTQRSSCLCVPLDSLNSLWMRPLNAVCV